MEPKQGQTNMLASKEGELIVGKISDNKHFYSYYKYLH